MTPNCTTFQTTAVKVDHCICITNTEDELACNANGCPKCLACPGGDIYFPDEEQFCQVWHASVISLNLTSLQLWQLRSEDFCADGNEVCSAPCTTTASTLTTTDTITGSTSTLSPDLCFVPGEVSGVLIGVAPVSSYGACLEECRGLSGCLWFTEYYEENLCGMFETMTDIHDDDCPSCISGNYLLLLALLLLDCSFTVLIINDRPYCMQPRAGRMQPTRAL